MLNSKVTRSVLFLPNLGWGTGGGTQRVLVNLAGYLVEHQMDVDFVLARKFGPYLSQMAKSVNVVDLQTATVWASVWPLARFLRRARVDVMLSALDHANVVALLARRIARVPTRAVISVRNTLSHHVAHSRHVRPWLLPAVRWTYPWADCVIGNSYGVIEDLQRIVPLAPHKVKVIYNPITPNVDQLSQEPCDHIGLTERQGPLFLGVGRLSTQKDFCTLISAFARVYEKVPSQLIILGEGAQRPQLEALIRTLHLEPHVRLPGFVPNPFPYMARADVFVLSSVEEGFPNVLLEAMACGTPVISTNCQSGPAELLANGLYGPLVPVGDANALATAMLAMLERPTNPELLRSRAAQFDMDTIAQQYIRVMKQEV